MKARGAGGRPPQAEYADWSPLAGKHVHLWPDNDQVGIDHMQQVAAILERLDPRPAVYWIAPEGLGLSAKGDVADFIDTRRAMTAEELRHSIEMVMEDADPMGASRELHERIEATIRGEYKPAVWPWQALSNLTNALLPGTVTVLCGDPGDGKSFLVLQAMGYWFDNGVKAAVLEMEESRSYHLLRALAQREDNANLTDHGWIETHPEDARQAFARHQSWLDRFGHHIWEASDRPMTQSDLVEWVRQRAQEGYRIAVIDPVTAAVASSAQTWVEDEKFLGQLRAAIRKHNMSVILVTHPKKGRKSAIGLDELAGGSSYQRFAQTIIWIERHQEPKSELLARWCGTEEGQINRTLHLCKTRNGKGHGLSIGFNFESTSLTFHEEGLIKPRE